MKPPRRLIDGWRLALPWLPAVACTLSLASLGLLARVAQPGGRLAAEARALADLDQALKAAEREHADLAHLDRPAPADRPGSESQGLLQAASRFDLVIERDVREPQPPHIRRAVPA